ncbi:MAG TPA: hypothetical protein VFD07_08450, partial [Candidatus Krumholzibacteria bacterium]|nr:hypothetical protein [Candidatus Krumholzibacteria bacterium]
MGIRLRTFALAAAGVVSLALGLWLRWMPPSHWLEAFTVDGHLEPATARFADSCWIFACIAGLVQCT